MAKSRDIPYSAFNFLVDIGGNADETSVKAAFSEVSGIQVGEISVAEYRGGNSKKSYVTKIPGITKAGDVTLKRGVIGSQDLYEWFEKARNGDLKAKRTVTIKLTDENPTNQEAVMTWKLLEAMPIKLTAPTLTAKGGQDVAVEELVLSTESVVQE